MGGKLDIVASTSASFAPWRRRGQRDPPVDEPLRGVCKLVSGIRLGLCMRWTKHFLKLLALSEPQAPNPEERPTEHTAPATAWRRWRTVHEIPPRGGAQPAPARAGSPAGNAPQDERGRFTNQHGATRGSHLGGLAMPEAEKREKCSATFSQRVEELRAGDYYGARVNPRLE